MQPPVDLKRRLRNKQNTRFSLLPLPINMLETSIALMQKESKRQGNCYEFIHLLRKICWGLRPQAPQNATSFGDRNMKMSLLKMRSYWNRIGSYIEYDWHPYKKRAMWRHKDTQEELHVMNKTDIRVMLPQAKACQRLQTTRS